MPIMTETGRPVEVNPGTTGAKPGPLRLNTNPHSNVHKRMSLECDQDLNPPTVFRPAAPGAQPSDAHRHATGCRHHRTVISTSQEIQRQGLEAEMIGAKRLDHADRHQR
jgi:hypothetical protein